MTVIGIPSSDFTMQDSLRAVASKIRMAIAKPRVFQSGAFLHFLQFKLSHERLFLVFSQS